MDRYLTDEEQARLLTTMKTMAGDALCRRDYAVVRALLHSGLRIGEFSRVSVGAALESLRSKYLFIPREDRKGWNRKPKKDGTLRRPPRDHKVFVTESLRQALRDLIAVRIDMRPDGCTVDDKLVLGRHGGGLTVRQFENRFALWAERAGLPPGASPHWLRHTMAMNLMRRSSAKDPRGVVKAVLGHESIRSTGVYTETPREEVEAALAEVSAPGRVSLKSLRSAHEARRAA